MGDLDSVYRECKEIMVDGKIDSCREAVNNGCRKCCRMCTFLFPGEELGDLPDGVKVVNGKVYDCMGDNGCKFDAVAQDGVSNKPLLCMMTPVVQAKLGDFGELVKCSEGSKVLPMNAFYISKGEAHSEGVKAHCPIVDKIPSDFRKKVIRVLQILEKVGVWNSKAGAKLADMSLDDLQDWAKAVSDVASVGDALMKRYADMIAVLKKNFGNNR